MPHRFLFGLLAAALLLALPARAQDEDEQAQPNLPDIPSQEFQITGELDVAFPTLERRPLSGFNPPPRVPDLPAGRQPFIGTYRQDAALIEGEGVDPFRPGGVGAGGRDVAEARDGYVRVLGGRYLARRAEAGARLALSPAATLRLHGAYDGQEGHEANTDFPDGTSSFDDLAGLIELDVQAGAVELSLFSDAFYTDYLLYGATPTQQAAVDEFPNRSGIGGALGLGLATLPTQRVHAEAQVRYGNATYETSYPANPVASSVDYVERIDRRLEGEALLSVPTRRLDVVADARGWSAGLDATPWDADVSGAEGGLGIAGFGGARWDVDLGLRVLTASASANAGASFDDGDDPLVYVAPSFALRASASRALHVYAQNLPHLTASSLRDLFSASPYLEALPAQQPEVTTTDAEAGIHVLTGPVRISAFGGYRYHPFLRYYEGTGASEIAARYDQAEVMRGGGEVAVRLPAQLHLTLGAEVRRAALTQQDDAEVPYLAPVTADAVLGWSFASGRGFAEATLRYDSARDRFAGSGDQVPAFFDLDLGVTYHFTDNLGGIVRAENLAGQDQLVYWEDYPRAPARFLVGLSWQW